MALSKELKAYINKRYDEKTAAIRKEMGMAVAKAELAHKVKYQEYAEMVLGKAQRLLEKAWETLSGEGFTPSSTLQNVLKGTHKQMYTPTFPASEIKAPFEARITVIDREREKLIITLSLEKDFERISAMLKEYGIEL